MKNFIKLLILSLSFLILLNGCSQSADLINTDKKNIVLIAKMNNGYHWGTVKLGAETAAREFNVNVTFVAPDDEEDVQGQIKLVEQALEEKKMDALVLAASDYKALVGVTEKAYNRGIPVIIIDSEVDTKKITSYVATDNLDTGKKAGNALVYIAGKECRVAIMSFVKGTRNAEQREEGLLGFIRQYPGIQVVSTQYCLSDSKLAYQLTKQLISEKSNLDAIVALNAISSEGVAEAIADLGLVGKIKIIAFDNTPKEIDYLDKGVIQATITQNPFSMGYLGVKYAVDSMNGDPVRKYYDTGSKIIDKNNMYLPENQKLLFPIVK